MVELNKQAAGMQKSLFVIVALLLVANGAELDPLAKFNSKEEAKKAFSDVDQLLKQRVRRSGQAVVGGRFSIWHGWACSADVDSTDVRLACFSASTTRPDCCKGAG